MDYHPLKMIILMLILVGLTNGKSIAPLTNEMINYINTLNTTWKAGKNFHDSSYDYVKKLAGTLIETGQLIKPKNYQIKNNENQIDIDLPEHFDARKVWPNCDSIATIRDQGACGSCWAVNTVSVMSDRLCIKSNGTINVQLSAEEVISCCDYCGGGCRNGYPIMAFDYWTEYGIVTGGQYQGDGCLPYSIPPCSHSVNGSASSCEEIGLSMTPSCSQECISGYDRKFDSDKFFGQKSYSFFEPYDIMVEIMTNGPVAASMLIYSDFYNYKSGVYQHETGERLGHHTVKLIGWGNDQGVDYWLAANSWNTDWGDEGFFKIKRGEDECEIETDVMASLPKHWIINGSVIKMETLIVLLIIFGVSSGKSFELSSELIDYINSLGTTWKAGKNFEGYSLSFVDNLVGTLEEPKESIKSKSNQINNNENQIDIDLPEHFDAREVWPNCDSIATIRDQGACGSCWAVSTVSVMSDRLCIKSNGTINVQLSSAEVMSCCGSNCGLGCQGGRPKEAYKYWIDQGIVTGGQYQGGGCLPYPIPPCEHHINGSRPSCQQLGKSETPPCSRQCISGNNFTCDKYYGSKVYSVKGTFQIMNEILTNGPVSAQMRVADDFYSYKSGVYQYTIGEPHGFHSVKLIGWGNDQGVDYWLAANSWNTDWGDDGYFKIKRGTDECRIESGVVAALPKL
ncbi:uncharacterized protein LOC128389527 [Panonychus citri]|uniref:uncharacterized protein LOC128389527 n=1 Tax=Panonychus citri TaxID=50023 RepID=UPI002306DE70|nr:uncharacterized protein LOC128389527 [Panonychus citri]